MTRPASVAAELAVPCSDIGRPESSHLVRIHRNGSVTTPDHHDSTEQQVAEVLGDAEWTTCAYWHAAAARHSALPNEIPAGRNRWEFTFVDLWTRRATWTALSGLLGERVETVVVDPVHVLGSVQAYLSVGMYPGDPIAVFCRLADPKLDERGWRRATPSTPVEVASFLQVGVPIDRVPSAVSLGVTPEVADVVIRQLRRARLPEELLFSLAYAVEPNRLPNLISGLSADDVRLLGARLSALRERFTDGEEFDGVTVEAFLLGQTTL